MEARDLNSSETQAGDHEKNRKDGKFPEIDFDVVLRQIGSFGRYQILLVMIAYYIAIPAMMNQVGSVFLAAMPQHRCRIPEIDDHPEMYPNLTQEELWQISTPQDPSTNKYDGCRRYVDSGENCTDAHLPGICFTNETTACDAGYVYDTSMYESTITTEWNLVCDRLGLGAIATTIYFCGVFFSAIVGGNLSDRFGRTRVMLGCQLLTVGLGIGCSYSPNLATFVALRFGIALFAIASLGASFVYMIEIVGDKWRTLVGITIQGVSAVGFIILSALSDRWRDWRQLQLVIALSSLVFIILWPFLPESPRWLFSKGKIEKAKKISHKMAKRNGRALSDDIWARAETTGGISEKQFLPHELLKRPHMRYITINIAYIWFVCSTVYYGLSLNVGSLAGDDRVNNVLSGLCEILACPMVILTMDRYGRRPVLAFSLFVGGFACLISTLINGLSFYHPGLATATTVLVLVGKFAASGAFALIYNYTGELFPTVVRGTAIGTGSMAARIGSISSPLIILIQHYVPWLPSVLGGQLLYDWYHTFTLHNGVTRQAVFGLLCVIAGFNCLRLPETNKMPLTTTLDEAESFYRTARKSNLTTVKESEEKEEML